MNSAIAEMNAALVQAVFAAQGIGFADEYSGHGRPQVSTAKPEFDIPPSIRMEFDSASAGGLEPAAAVEGFIEKLIPAAESLGLTFRQDRSFDGNVSLVIEGEKVDASELAISLLGIVQQHVSRSSSIARSRESGRGVDR